MNRNIHQRIVAVVCLCFVVSHVDAQDKKGAVPKGSEFAPADKGVYLSGELAIVDAINRRGALRLDGDGPMHYFAMLPYGMIGYDGAPAELRDISLGAHVHGYFHVPPAGDEATIPPHQ